MRRIRRIIAAMSLAPLTLGLGCGSGAASNTVDYNPATNNDTTKPWVNLLVARPGEQNLEVQAQTIPSSRKSTNYGNPVPPVHSDFSVLATATDSQSGIRHVKLNMTRTVCYTSSAGNVAQAYFGTITRKEATYTDQAHAPVQASLGDTGVIDASAEGTDSTHITDPNLLVWRNANGVLSVGVGVSTKWGMEATNFAGQTTYSDVIFVLSGNVSCVTSP